MKNFGKKLIAGTAIALALCPGATDSLFNTNLFTIEAEAATSYYPACASKYTSIVDALKSIGVDSSLSFRKKIAAANSISNYTGTSSQNTTMLNLLKKGKLIKPSSGTTTVAVSSVSLNKTSVSLNVGGTTTLTATVSPSNATNKTITWSTSNSSIATVSNGKITAKAKGTATITAKSNNGKTATCNVTINPNSSTGSVPSGVVTHSSYNITSTSRAKEVSPHYTNAAGKRSAAAYNFIINQFSVETNPRYKVTNGNTWCNIFAWDVMYAMGLSSDFSNWIDKNQKPCASGSGSELNANATYNWLATKGSSYGWTSVSAYDAQQKANNGYPTIAVYYNKSGHGHVMVVRPETSTYKYKTNSPVIAQAGSSNKNYSNVSTSLSPIKYYYHK